MTRSVFPIVLLLAGIGSASASLSGLVGAWGRDFVVTPFESKDVMMAVAKDRTTGTEFNLIKMPGGHVMAVVPLDAMKDMSAVDSKDILR